MERHRATVNIESVATLRAVIGYLGEKDLQAWWPTSFFSTSSQPFLIPVFGRTRLLAQCTGVSQAASHTHDDRIGVGRVHHLFRLPEDMEQDVFQTWQRHMLVEQIDALVASQEAATGYLRSVADQTTDSEAGPVLAGSSNDLLEEAAWGQVASLYLSAVETKHQVFPYFADIAT